ncbi:hypothetical protein [Sulfurospirillum diekertiae]|uniref:Uncharacterized protein n=1 Tax=Sulfurospirillum diekertiae TaxID=1854492 RepID=A0A1Y0HJL8_9BACT|nr:hypothetical protein [Sulfurospirillum diekertiae]ARU48309.1 hypothetical protein Sdiek1_1143 [Sulfurospirillum diekertiae]ASC93148.1 hypothetical protein Sdiek2_1127 [Sulfurospirillum diekertiae]
MAVSATDCQTFLKSSFGLKNVTSTTLSELRCLTCGKIAYQSGSYVYCKSNITAHRKTNLDYMKEITKNKADLIKALENYTFIDKAI